MTLPDTEDHGAYDYPLIIKQLLITPLRQSPGQEIVYRDTRRLTYREFGQRVHRLGSALAGLGVRHGDTVAVMDWDSHRYLECFFGIPMAGAVLMTVNVRLSPEQILYTIDHAKTDVIVCNTEFLPLLRALRPALTRVKKFIAITEDGRPAPDEGFAWDGDYEQLLAAGDPHHVFPDFNERTRATTFYTTGTTGNPKGVYYSHRQIVLHTLSGLATMSFTPTDVYMPITPMFHVHAWGNPYNVTARGLKQVYPGRYSPELLVRLFVAERVTFSHCVPTILQMFLDAARDVDLRGWRVIIGGSALPRALAQTALDRGIDVFAGYGMSETGPMATVSLVPPELRDGGETELTYRCRAGRPVPLCDVRIVDSQMRELPQDGVSAGEIVLRSPWLTQGYLDNPEASAALWHGGWLHTGDIGTIDEHGFLGHNRPHQGRGENRWRMGQQPATGGHPRPAPLRRRGGGDRRARRALGGTARGHRRGEDGGGGRHGTAARACDGLCRAGRHFEICLAGARGVCGEHRQDERGQARQEAVARAVRAIGATMRRRPQYITPAPGKPQSDCTPPGSSGTGGL